MTANVPTSDSGTATAGMTVAATFRRNTKMTSTTRPTVRHSSNSTSARRSRGWSSFGRSARRMFDPRPGSARLEPGEQGFCTASTTAMMFAPGCRWMFRMTAGVRSIHAAWRTFSAPSVTVATSLRRIGAPSR